MPFTLNGVGTRYYGDRNRSSRIDVCKSCNRSATLSSYDTREFFCVLYIPLIPLTKYRILDDCASCRRHHRISQKEFTSQLVAATEPLREAVRRSPTDPQPVLDLAHALIGWEMREDAQQELDAAVQKFPQHAGLHLLGGQLSMERTDWNRALWFYERACAIEPQNTAALYGHGWLLHQLGRDEEAIVRLHETLRFAEDRNALYLLGSSLSRTERWSEALNTYQRLLALEPAYASDKPFLKLIAECKRHVGYELTDAERRASRRWWPFGGGTKRPKPPRLQQPTLVRPALRIPGLIILALVIVGGLYYAWERYSIIPLYVHNGLTRPVQVELDGKTFDVGAHGHEKQSLEKGSHAIVIRESDGTKELERMTFEIPSISIIDALMHDRLFVYNVAMAGVFRRAVHGYAQNESDSTYSQEFVGMRRFFEQRDVDYAFERPPDEIKMDSGKKVEEKVAFQVANDVPLSTYAMLRMHEKNAEEAKSAIRQAVALAPCEAGTRQTQLYITATLDSLDAASAAARQWIVDCATDDLEAHRQYQQLEIARGKQSALWTEYRNRLAAAPDSAQAHYLVGRIAVDPNIALAEHHEAIRLDPKFVWPRMAVGYVLSEEERFDEAMRELDGALAIEGHDPAVLVYYARAAIAKGNPTEAVAKVDQALSATPKEFAALHARWTLAAAAGEWVRAEAMLQSFGEIEPSISVWERRLALLELKGDDAAADQQIEAGLKQDELHLDARRAQVDRLLAKGEYTVASSLLRENVNDFEPDALVLRELYTAGGLTLRGDAAAARQLLTDAAKHLNPKSTAYYVQKALIAGMNGTMPAEQVVQIARDQNQSEHGWVVAGVRAAAANDRARAEKCFARAARHSPDLMFPHLEAKKMAELVRPQ